MKQAYRDSIVYTSKSKSFDNYLKWCDEKEKVFLEICKHLKPTFRTMLDIGAGNGLLTKKFIPFFKIIIAIEPSEKLAPELRRSLKGGKTRIIQAKFEETKLKEKFDFILLCHAAYYLKDLEKELGRIKQILAERGIFMIVHQAAKGSYQRFRQKFRKDIVGTRYSRSITSKEIIAALKKSGFNVTEKVVNSELVVPSVQDMISMLDFLYNVDEKEVKEAVKSKIRKYLTEKFGRKDIRLDFPHSVLICTKGK